MIRRLLLPVLVLAASLPARAFDLRLAAESTNAVS